MHRCLSIAEVQRNIFQEVFEDGDYDGWDALAGLARTCRTFSDVALDVLWERLDSFVPLIQCLPQDLWKIETTDQIMTFQRSMLRTDWEIFFKYSPRVRFLRQPNFLRMCDCECLSDDVIEALSNPPTNGPLVPHLKELRWNEPDGKHASLLRLLLPPSLISLSLPFAALRSFEASILSMAIPVGTVRSSLKHLSIALDEPFINATDANGNNPILSEAILHLHSLESLECPVLNEAAVAHVCHLPFLTDLSLELPRNLQLQNVLPSAFTSLSTLDLRATTLSTLTSLLKPVRFRPESLFFDVEIAPTPEAVHLFFLTLATACCPEKLSRVSLTTSLMDRPIPDYEVSLSTFQPLFLFPSIHSFKFDLPFCIILDNEAIWTLSKSWAKLTELSLNASWGWGVMSRVTHKGLLILLLGCPALTTLEIAINFARIDVPSVPDVSIGYGVTNNSCSIINFVTSVIWYPVSIAAFLSDVCPRVCVVTSSWDDGIIPLDEGQDDVRTFREQWGIVHNILPKFAAVRKQCMNSAKRRKKARASLT